MRRTAALAVAIALCAVGAPAPADGPAPLFATSDRCLACHDRLATPSGEDISIGFAWRASIMANAARDPYWQAAVRRETLDHPADGAAIQDECAACHMPMARFQDHVAGRQTEIFSRLPVEPRPGGGDPLAIDGVSCSLCHQLQNGGPGMGLEHDAEFRIDVTRAWGQRPALGPYDVPQPRAGIMRSATGFIPQRADNIERSELCSTCHTLYTMNDAGTTAGGQKQVIRFPEQVPYLEWQASAFAREKTCQACHMTFVAERAPATSVLGEPRDNVARHGFQGANFLMLGMLARFAAELGVQALPQELSLSRARTLELLRTGAATLSIARAGVRDGRLEAEVVVANTTGHKLPTAYPSRRAWLRFVVRDAAGRPLFASGELRPDGSIEGNDNDRDPLAFEPHRRVIESAEQVQIYESIMADARGRVTTGLLSAVRYAKDNRLLPRGLDKAAAASDYAVRGQARDDPDFQGGGDRVLYRVNLPAAATGPFRIDVELLYQPIAYRWAHNLEAYRAAAEPARFVGYYDAMSGGTATRLAAASASLP
ncbi:MAG TPA: hypothetical protein VMT03_19890 [Polyangia bacterium]|nr:hypothetical protein [Polyangia bacterium]